MQSPMNLMKLKGICKLFDQTSAMFYRCFIKIMWYCFHPEIILFSPRNDTPAGNFKKPKIIMWIWETMLRNAIVQRVFFLIEMLFQKSWHLKNNASKKPPQKTRFADTELWTLKTDLRSRFQELSLSQHPTKSYVLYRFPLSRTSETSI